MNYRWPFFTKIRYVLDTIVTPIHYLVDFPVEVIGTVADGLTSNRSLVEENASLKAQQLLLKAKIQRFLTVEKENKQLRALLGSSPNINGKVLVGQVLAVDSDSLLQQVIINHGSSQQVYVGQPVLDAHGIMGQVVQVTPWTSRVMLLNDSRSGIPVNLLRNNLRTIAVGTGALDELQLVNIPVTADIKLGDKVVSSGLGLRYPSGYPVGTISKIFHQKGAPYLNVKIKPAAKLNRSRLILFIWPKKSALRTDAEKQIVAMQNKDQSLQLEKQDS